MKEKYESKKDELKEKKPVKKAMKAKVTKPSRVVPKKKQIICLNTRYRKAFSIGQIITRLFDA